MIVKAWLNLTCLMPNGQRLSHGFPKSLFLLSGVVPEPMTDGALKGSSGFYGREPLGVNFHKSMGAPVPVGVV